MVETQWSIAQLQQAIANKKAAVSGLHTKRQGLVEQLQEIEGKIAQAEGGKGRKARPHMSARVAFSPKVTLASNGGRSLKSWVIDVLKVTPDLTLSEVQAAVLKAGYKTSSANFKGTLYQCLYHNREFVLKNKKYQLAKTATTLKKRKTTKKF